MGMQAYKSTITDVQETAPTADQLTSILEYLGPAQAGSVIADATGTTDALKKFKANESLFKAPVTVDWMNARAGMLDSMLSIKHSCA
jgi:arsenate reductase-like glutaredoxin family protein